MSFCVNCGHELAEGAKYCANCGKVVNDDYSTSQRRTIYEGNLHKCPSCGEVLNSFVTNCPTCGHEIRDTQCFSSVKQLAMKLEQLEAQRPPKKATNIFTQYFTSGMLQGIDQQKIDLIRNFSIPNTKEDVLEFIVLAAANIDLKVYGLEGRQILDPACRELSDAWLSKLEQADQKAEIMFGQTQEYISLRNVYGKKMKAITKQKRQKVWLLAGSIGLLLLMFVFLALMTYIVLHSND